MQKYIKEVFKDYNGKNEILDAEIENVNLYKKTNKLQVKVVSKNRITLDDIEDFEKVDLAKATEQYLENLGLSQKEIADLKDRLK